MTSPDPLNLPTKTALACIDDPEGLRLAVEHLSSIGYEVNTGISLEDLLYKMQANTYDILLIAENVGGSTLETNPLLGETQRIPAGQRLSQVVILVGQSFTTADEAQAYQYSVDQVIGTADLQNLRPLARRAVTRAEEFYGRYNEAIAAADKAAT